MHKGEGPALIIAVERASIRQVFRSKDFARAENLVAELSKTAKHFDVSKPMAAIETAKQISAMHIAKARHGAVSGDKETLEAELKAATEIWPRSPALTDVSQTSFLRRTSNPALWSILISFSARKTTVAALSSAAEALYIPC